MNVRFYLSYDKKITLKSYLRSVVMDVITFPVNLKELLVNRLFKPAQEKVWLGELIIPQWP